MAPLAAVTCVGVNVHAHTTYTHTHMRTNIHIHIQLHTHTHTYTQVSKERIRVLEFMRDYDKLRSGRIPCTSFRRALDLCGFGLSQMEVAALEERWVGSQVLRGVVTLRDVDKHIADIHCLFLTY